LEDKKLTVELEESTLKERLEEEKNEMLGKEKVVNEDVEETRNKQMSFWEEIEENLEKLEKLEEEYGPFIKGNDFDPFDDEKLTTDTLRKRKDYSFLERSEMLKKRVSFFGIFCAGENIEMVYS